VPEGRPIRSPAPNSSNPGCWPSRRSHLPSRPGPRQAGRRVRTRRVPVARSAPPATRPYPHRAPPG